MTVIGEAFVAIRALTNAQQFEQDITKGVQSGAQRAATNVAKILGSATVLRGLKSLAQEGIAELEQAAAAQAQTAAAIASTGGVANVSAEQIEKLAGAEMRLTGVDDEVIQQGANKLLTFTRVRNEVGKGNDIFNQATKAALDLSRAGFGSVESASVLLGKALNDPVSGLTALQRVGVRLTDDQKNLVKELVNTGDVLGAQKVILEEVNTQVGGSAEAYGNTLPGKLAIARESLANTQGQLLAGMAPALTLTADATTFLTEQFAKQPEALQAVEGGLLLVVGGLGSIITPLKAGIDLWRSFGAGAQAAAAAADISSGVTNSAASVDNLYGSTSRLTGATKVLAGVGIVGVVAGLAAWGQSMDGLDVDLQKLSDSLFNTSEAAQESVDQTLVLAKASGDLDNIIRDLAGTDAVAAQALLDRAAATGLSSDKTKEYQGIIDDAREADVRGTVAKNEYTGQQQAATEAAAAGIPVEEALAGATGEAAVATGEATDALVPYEDKLQEARDAVEALFNTTESAIDADFRYRDAKDSTADALAKLTELQKAGKGFTDEYRRASDDAAQTMFDQAKAAADLAAEQYELSGVTLDASDKANIQKAELQKLADTLAPGSSLRRQLEGMIQQLGRVPSAKKVKIDVLTGQALVDIDRLARRIREKLIDQGIRVSVGGGGGVQLSAGGQVPLYAASGVFVPKGTDTVPAMLTPGEWVINRQAVNYWGTGMLDAINRMQPPGVASVPTVTFGPGSVVVHAAPGMSEADARRLGAAVGDAAADRIEAQGIAVLGRVQ